MLAMIKRWARMSCRKFRCAIALVPLAICAVAWSASAGAMQPDDNVAANPSAPLPPVTVTAARRPDTRQLANEIVPAFVKSHGKPAPTTGQLARWRVGICPLTRGLSPAANAFVTARVRAVAATVGAPTQEAGQCAENVQIIFTTEPQKVLDDVVERYRQLLGFHYVSQEKQLATFSRPIQAWYVTATRGAKGAEVIDSIFGVVPPGRLGSRLTTGMSSAFVYALVVADASKVDGLTFGSIADYIAVLTLSQAQSLDACSELPSIVDLLSSGCGERPKPEAMTASDAAYMRALYSIDLELQLGLERSQIHVKMMQEIEGH
jgi:hypothetical protein